MAASGLHTAAVLRMYSSTETLRLLRRLTCNHRSKLERNIFGLLDTPACLQQRSDRTKRLVMNTEQPHSVCIIPIASWWHAPGLLPRSIPEVFDVDSDILMSEVTAGPWWCAVLCFSCPVVVSQFS